MKVFAVRRLAAVEPASYLRDRIAQKMRRAAAGLAALNTRVDEARSLRDRANQASHTVDQAFWIYLR